MDSLRPADIVSNMVQAGIAKAALGPFDLLVRGILSGALLGCATSLAIGDLPRARTISSPASTRASNCDNWVLAAWIVTISMTKALAIRP